MGKVPRKDQGDGSKTYVLQVDMHCECTGCIKKITHGIKEINLLEGVERADLVAETGEVTVVGKMKPERFCCLLQEITKKSVRIVTQSNLSEGRTTTSQQFKNLFGQAPSDWLAPEARETTSQSGRQGGVGGTIRPVTPSAPQLPPEDWRETVPSERCWYRWPAPASSTLGFWTPSDVSGTLATYEL